MTTQMSLSSLITKLTKTQVFDKAIEVATTLSLPVTSWFEGDPTRSMYWVLAEIFETLEDVAGDFISAGFLDLAPEGIWLNTLAYQVFGYEPQEATWATCTVTLSNAGGGLYEIQAGDLTVKDSTTGVTFHSTTDVAIPSGPGTTATVTVVADTAGMAGSAGIGEIDEMVTTFLGVTCANTTAAVGLDAESKESIIAGCRAKLGSLSPNGPKDAYNYVAKRSVLTGTSAVTRARTYGDTDTGDVLLYIAGSTGHVEAADVTAVEAAIVQRATPQCITPTVASAVDKLVDVTASIWVYDTVGVTKAQIRAAVNAALLAMFARRPIGGDSGYMRRGLIESTIERVYPDHCFEVTVTLPAADVALTVGEVAVLGTLTMPDGNIHFVEEP